MGWRGFALVAGLGLALSGGEAAGQEGARPPAGEAENLEALLTTAIESAAAVCKDPAFSTALGTLGRIAGEGRWEDLAGEIQGLYDSGKDSGQRLVLCMLGTMAAMVRGDVDVWAAWTDRARASARESGNDVSLGDFIAMAEPLRAGMLLQQGRGKEARATLLNLLAGRPGTWKDENVRDLLGQASAASPPVVVETYNGKYDADFRLPAAIQAVKEGLQPSMARLCARLGVEKLDLPPFAVIFGDSGVAGEEEGEGEHYQARTWTSKVAGVRTGLMEFRTEPLVAGELDLDETLVHELVHLLEMPVEVGNSPTPEWISEGIAHWASWRGEEGPEGMVLADTLHIGRRKEGPKGGKLTEVMADEGAILRASSWRGRVAGAFLFRHLEESRGGSVARKAALRILASEEWRKVLEEAAGKPLAVLLQESAESCRAWGQRAFTGIDDLMAASREAGAEPAKGVVLVDRFLDTCRPGPLRGYGEYLRARCLGKAGRLEEALAAFRAFRRAHPRHRLVTDSLVDEMTILSEKKDADAARILARMFLRDHGWKDPAIEKEVRGFLESVETELKKGPDRKPGREEPRGPR